MWRLQIAAGEEVRIDTVPALVAALDMLEAGGTDRPPLAVLTAQNGDSLIFGFSGGEGVVSYVPGDGSSPSYSSKGSCSTGDMVVLFAYLGHWTEIPAHRMIPASLARGAVLRFFTHRELCGRVEWEQE